MKRLSLLKEAFREWNEDKAPLLGAGLAYFALFSIAPLLVIAIAIAGIFFGQEATQGKVVESIDGLVGPQGARAIQGMIEGASRRTEQGKIGLIGGIIAIVFGASGVFAHLKETLNMIWGVKPAPKKGFVAKVLSRVWAVGMVLSVGFLLLVSLLLSAALAAVGSWMSGLLPMSPWIWQVVNGLVSLAVITVVFAAIFRWIPDTEIAWQDVWAGALFTALLFVIGKFLIGLYLGRSAVSSSYGAAASVVVVVLWLYYSSLIILFGAEFTEVRARERQGLASRGERRAREGGE